MKRFIYSFLGVAALICVVLSGIASADVDVVTENAMGDYGSCATHLYANNGEYTVVTKATCEEGGTQFRSCIVCGYKDIVKTEKDPDNHTQLSSIWSYQTKPTCVSGGVKYKVCYACNSMAEITDVEADPEAHVVDGDPVVLTAATCVSTGEKAYKCTHCDSYFGNEVIPVDNTSHTVSENSKWEVTTLPTCALDGTMIAYCDSCGDIAETRSVAATGEHDLSKEWTVDVEATCVSDGSMSHHCLICLNAYDVTVIPADVNDHTFAAEYTTDKAADCVSKGIVSRHCIYCDATTDIMETDIDKTNHSYSDEWVITKQATCSSTGLKHKVCTLCGEDSVSAVIKRLAHTYPDEYEVITESADGLSARVKYLCTVCGEEYITVITYGDNSGDGDIGDGSVDLNVYKIVPTEKSKYSVDYKTLIISNVAKNTTVDDFMNNFTNSSVFVAYDKQGDFLEGARFIGTGCRLNFQTINGLVTDYSVSVTGDVDSDGKVTAADARLVLRAAAKIDTLENEYFVAADVNSDGKVTAADARKTLQVSANMGRF